MKKFTSFIAVVFCFLLFVPYLAAGGGTPPPPGVPAEPGRLVGVQIGKSFADRSVTLDVGQTLLQEVSIIVEVNTSDRPTQKLVPGLPKGFSVESKNNDVLRVVSTDNERGIVVLQGAGPGVTTLFVRSPNGKVVRTEFGAYTVVFPAAAAYNENSTFITASKPFYEAGERLLILVHARQAIRASRLNLAIFQDTPDRRFFPRLLPLKKTSFAKDEELIVDAGEIPVDAEPGAYRFYVDIRTGDLSDSSNLGYSHFSVFVGDYTGRIGNLGRVGESSIDSGDLYNNYYTGQPWAISIYGGWFPKAEGPVLVFMDGVLISQQPINGLVRDFVQSTANWNVTIDFRSKAFPVRPHNFLLYFTSTGTSLYAEKLLLNDTDPAKFDPDPFSNQQGQARKSGLIENNDQDIIDGIKAHMAGKGVSLQ